MDLQDSGFGVGLGSWVQTFRFFDASRVGRNGCCLSPSGP